MWHKPCRTFHPWCLCIKTRCLYIYPVYHIDFVHIYCSSSLTSPVGRFDMRYIFKCSRIKLPSVDYIIDKRIVSMQKLALKILSLFISREIKMYPSEEARHSLAGPYCTWYILIKNIFETARMYKQTCPYIISTCANWVIVFGMKWL